MKAVINLILLTVVFCDAVRFHHQHTHHKRLTKRELGKVFGVDEVHEVPLYHLGKLRRQGNNPLSIKISGFGSELRLNLSLDQSLIARGHTIEFYGADGKVEKYLGSPGEFASGIVRGEDGSHVALHHSGRGVSGSIKTKKDMFFINPLPRRLQTSKEDHVIFRHTGNHFGCGSHDIEETARAAYARQKRSTTTQKEKKTIEVMIAGDYTMVQHYSKLFLPTYLLAISNIMAGLFKDPSLEYPIDIVVTRTAIFETDVFKASSMGDLLSKFTNWVQINNNPDDSNPNHVDNALLLTRNGCADQCSLEGLAISGAMCKSNAESVNKDRGLLSAVTMAHELAHNLGVGHDSSVECPDGINIMATGSANGLTIFQWSKCSSDKIKSQMMSDASNCYNDVPDTHKTNSSFQLYGKVYNGDKQCEFTYGEGFIRCAHREKYCSQLSCQMKGDSVCKALQYPAVHGTRCGDHLHCIHGLCIPDGTLPEDPVNGQWGEWSEYTKCNQECGIGVQWKIRKCNNPTPKYGGNDCKGDSKGFFKTCNTQPCETGTPSFRLQQCQNLSISNKDFYDARKPCHLICGSSTAAYYYGLVKDGTRCTPGGLNMDICVQGICKKVGCDLGLETGTVVDRCGVCKGPGNTCELVTGSDYGVYASPGDYVLSTVPAGSTNMLFKEVGNTFNFIGFKVGNSTSFAFNVPSFSVNYQLGNVTISYLMEGFYFSDELRSIKPLPQPLKTFLVNRYNVKSEGVKWSYYKPLTSRSAAPQLKLVPTEWDTCSKSCGGGQQMRSFVCKIIDDDSEVSLDLCNNLTKPKSTQSCNLIACPAEWHITQWTKCTKSCGNGTQLRKLYCSRIDVNGVRVTVPDAECTLDQPEITSERRCNVVHCPADWHYGNWTECSKSCGGGDRSRTVQCKHIDSNGILQSISAIACNYLGDALVSETCNADVQCAEWNVKYSACSKTCGGGIQSPSFVCTDPNTGKQVNEDQCLTIKPSAEIKTCNEQLCEIFIWKQREGVCSVTCGPGLRPVELFCYDQSKNTKADDESNCPQPKPELPEPVACDAGTCPEVYEWKTVFSRCSVTCGQGEIVTVPYCQRQSDEKEVDKIFCDPSKVPEIVKQPCKLDDCIATYSWKSEYGECSVTCGSGVMTTIHKCINDEDKSEVNSTLCQLDTKTALSKKLCTMQDCPPVVSWLLKNSTCSATCGEGTMTSLPVCTRVTDGMVMSDDSCDSKTKPKNTSYSCLIKKCLSPHYWKASYGKCVAKCGPGYRLKFVDCILRENGAIVDSKNCADYSLPEDQPCEEKKCVPAFVTDKMPPSYAVGCFNDIPTPRRVPIYLGNFNFPKNDSMALIKRCAEQAQAMGYTYFSLQFHKECWAGDENTANSYYLNGASNNCKNGVGTSATNFVYKIGSPEVIKAVPAIKKLGCYIDDIKSPRPLPKIIDSFRHFFSWKERNYDDIISLCARSTHRRQWKVFGIQYYGECWSGENAEKTFMRAGKTDNCWNGFGKFNTNYVYAFMED